MSKSILNISSKSFGPYSTAAWAGDLLYVSGTTGFSAEEQRMIQDSIEEETHQVMKNIANVLAAAELTWDDVVKASIFLTNMDDYANVNDIYGRYFDIETAPARETMEVSRLPAGARVEISVIASK